MRNDSLDLYLENDWEPEEEPDPGQGILPLIDLESFYDLLMEQQEQM